MPDDIITEVARRLNLPREQVRIVMSDFFNAIKIAVQQPHKFFVRGVKVRKCGKWEINPKVIIKKYFSTLRYHPDSDTFKKLEIVHKNNIKHEVYTQRQQERIKILEGFEHDKTRAEGTNKDEDSSQQ